MPNAMPNAKIRRARDRRIAREVDEYLDAEAARFVVETERKVAESSARWGFAYADESGHYSPKLYDDAQRAAQIRWDVRQIKKQRAVLARREKHRLKTASRCRAAEARIRNSYR